MSYVEKCVSCGQDISPLTPAGLITKRDSGAVWHTACMRRLEYEHFQVVKKLNPTATVTPSQKIKFDENGKLINWYDTNTIGVFNNPLE